MNLSIPKKTNQQPADAHSIPLNAFYDAILRNHVNSGAVFSDKGKQAARVVMLNENAWLLLDVAGMPLWGLA